MVDRQDYKHKSVTLNGNEIKTHIMLESILGIQILEGDVRKIYDYIESVVWDDFKRTLTRRM